MTAKGQLVYSLLKTVPKGKVTTYKELARASGINSPRAIGQFMKKNPFGYSECHDPKTQVPCHRVVASNGTLGGFMGKTTGLTIDKKIKMLEEEGITILKCKIHNFPSVFYSFST
jgi:methylated-DNA-[protein]-cysteine S-methyltransferase